MQNMSQRALRRFLQVLSLVVTARMISSPNIRCGIFCINNNVSL